MNCARCGIKIMPSLAKQQEGGEDLCRGCYGWKLAKDQEYAARQGRDVGDDPQLWFLIGDEKKE